MYYLKHVLLHNPIIRVALTSVRSRPKYSKYCLPDQFYTMVPSETSLPLLEIVSWTGILAILRDNTDTSFYHPALFSSLSLFPGNSVPGPNIYLPPT